MGIPMLEINQITTPNIELENWLQSDPVRNGLLLYNLTGGFDLCDWYFAKQDGDLTACLCLYKGNPTLPSLVTRGDSKAVSEIINQLNYPRLFSIIPQNHTEELQAFYTLENPNEFQLMAVERTRFFSEETRAVKRLTLRNLFEVDAFYRSQAASAWHPKQLEIGPYYCIQENNRIVSICGTLAVYPKTPGVAVIGNLITLPAFRRKGYGTSVLSAVVQSLFKRHQWVTLLVVGSNTSAIRMYQQMGFRFVESFIVGFGKRKKIDMKAKSQKAISE
jgi:ribosomal protein S18 acetylase RimI-like enzyme